MHDMTLGQYVTTLALSFFLGGLVGFIGSVFTMAPRLPMREPPDDTREHELPQRALDDFHAWQRRQRLAPTDFEDRRARLHRIGVKH